MTKAARGERTCSVCGKQVSWFQVKTYRGKATCIECIKADQEHLTKQQQEGGKPDGNRSGKV